MRWLRRRDREPQIGGSIGFYGLSAWWTSEFTQDERDYIESKYRPMGDTRNRSLTEGEILSSSQPPAEFLNGLSTWFRSSADRSIASRIHAKINELGRLSPIEGPGYFQGRHFTTFVEEVKDLKRAGKVNEAEQLLLSLVDAAEAESHAERTGVAPWYYEQLAIICRQRKDFASEVEILERFAHQKHARGVKPAQLLGRLDKARSLHTDTK